MNDGDNVKDDDDRVDIISRKAGEKHFRCEQCNYSSKDTRSSLQSPLSKTKPNRTYETIVSYTAIFSDSAKPNIRNL